MTSATAKWPVAALVAALSLPAPSVWANEAEDAFVEANLLGIFYHELGHAMIDVLGLPVFGQEEDAADVASVLMIEAFFDPESALDLAYDASFGFAAEAMLAETEGYEVAWWDTHGPDEQRFYNTVCLFYGADPENRDGFAEDMGLPEERAELCADEFDLAWDSWGPVFDDLSEMQGRPLRLDAGGNSLTAQVISAEVAALNEDFSWSEPLSVVVAECGEANAFYDLDTREIIMCLEFEDHLRDLYRLSE